MPGSPAHLVRRFIDVATARPLTEQERRAIERVLQPELSEIFFDQPQYDQRHGFHASLMIRRLRPRPKDELVVAALLHDVGKRHSRLGLIGRSMASVFILLRLRLPERFARYRDHGPLAADELMHTGAPHLAVEFARHHHEQRPDSIAVADWTALQLADQPPKPV